LFINIIVGS